MNWLEEYSVGDEQFDADHKKIFDLINRLDSAAGDLANTEFLEAILEDLIEYTDDHFEREEKFMRDIGYKGLVEHHARHAELDEKLHGLYNRLHDGETNVAKDVVELLKQWWNIHILKEDMAYKQAAK